jgi:hypothetical protein
MRSGIEETTATAAAAGAAAGAVVGWVISTTTGADTASIMGPLATLGAFAFGRLFPR